VATQLNKTASIFNSLSIEGSATLMEDTIKGVMNELVMARVNTDF